MMLFRHGFFCVCLLFYAAGFSQSYSTNFDAPDENPISEGGVWSNQGLDWTYVKKTGGVAFGTQPSTDHGYDDSYALLSGFPPDHSVTAVVYRDPSGDFSCTKEVEILLRASDGPNFIRCYEILNAGNQVVRWNGAIGDFTVIGGGVYIPGGLQSGDSVTASIVGNVITIWVNGSQVYQMTDNVLTTGNPGMAFFRRNCGSNTDFGWTSFSATGIGGASMTSLSVTPASSSVEELLTRQFTATAYYSNATNSNVTGSAVWSSTNTAVATVNSAGLASGKGPGTAKIIAVYNSFRDTADLTVTATTATLDSLVITGNPGSVAKGGTAPLTAMGYYSNATTQDKTGVATWSSGNATIATVSSTGVVSGVSLGTVTIRASYGGKEDSVSIQVINQPAFVKKINFQPPSTAVPAGYVADSGLAYSAARGYGWEADQGETRERGVNSDKRYDTFVKTYSPTQWTLDLPSPGQYKITVVMGDPSYATAETLKMGSQTLIAAPASTTPQIFTDTLIVSGSQLVLTVTGAICYIDVESAGGGTSAVRINLSEIQFERIFPNPFHGSTAIHYSIDGFSPVQISIYDHAGRRVRLLSAGERAVGHRSVMWDGRDQANKKLSSGVYFAKVSSGRGAFTQKLLLMQ